MCLGTYWYVKMCLLGIYFSKLKQHTMIKGSSRGGRYTSHVFKFQLSGVFLEVNMTLIHNQKQFFIVFHFSRFAAQNRRKMDISSFLSSFNRYCHENWPEYQLWHIISIYETIPIHLSLFFALVPKMCFWGNFFH